MAKKYNIAVIPGDGIGPEITSAAIEVLETACSRNNIELFTKELKAGGAAIDEFGIPLPKETVSSAMDSDAVLLLFQDLCRSVLFRPGSGIKAGKSHFGIKIRTWFICKHQTCCSS